MMTINTSNNPTEVIELIKHCKDIIKTQYNRVIKYIYKRGKILKMVKQTENFFDGSEQSRFTIYFKIAVYKILKNSTLPASYFRNDLKSIMLVCKKHQYLFSR